MNRIAKLAVPAALALAAFGAQAEGFSPSAGARYADPTAQASAPAPIMVERVTPFTPVAGGTFKGQAAPVRTGAEAMSLRPTTQRLPGA